MTYEAGQILNLFLYSIPFWIPGAIGLYLVAYASNPFRRMAGLLTLKPIVTTPIWFAIIYTRLPYSIHKLEPAHFLTILPGAGVTIMIVLLYWRLFYGPRAGSAKALLMLDCIRWLNSFLLILPYGGGTNGALNCLFAFVGLAMPTVFAMVAFTLSQSLAYDEK